MATKKQEEQDVQSNVIVLRNKRKIEIKPTKLKYFTSGDYSLYKVFEEYPIQDVLITNDGEDFALRFLSAVLDESFEVNQVEKSVEGEKDSIYVTEYKFNDELKKMYENELSLDEFRKIIEVSKEVNGITGKN